MMRKEDLDRDAAARPLKLRLVDGQRFRFSRIEQFLVACDHVLTLDRRSRPVTISIGLISTIGPPARPRSRRRPRP